jgi:peptidoglycan/LPS O-acetylase OafA/YrhL
MQTVNNSNRIAFLDNIRSLIIVLVLIFHSGASYGSGVEFWPFHENNPSGIIDFFMFIGDVFFMAIMFFIAGYFVLPDFLKKGLCRFLKDKLKRLGLPWLVITTTAVVPFTFPLLLSNISIPVFITIYYCVHSYIDF